MRTPLGLMTNMWGVVLAPKRCPTVPEGSMSVAVGKAPWLFTSWLAIWGVTEPSAPGAEEMTENQTTPFFVQICWTFSIFPLYWLTTKGQLWLCHSKTTYLPL